MAAVVFSVHAAHVVHFRVVGVISPCHVRVFPADGCDSMLPTSGTGTCSSELVSAGPDTVPGSLHHSIGLTTSPIVDRRLNSPFVLFILLFVGVETNPGPTRPNRQTRPNKVNDIKIGSLVTRYAVRHATVIHATVADESLGALCICETWFQPATPDTIRADIVPPSCSVIGAP